MNCGEKCDVVRYLDSTGRANEDFNEIFVHSLWHIIQGGRGRGHISTVAAFCVVVGIIYYSLKSAIQ